MESANSHAKDHPGRHEHQCPVCGWAIRSSLQRYFQEFCCSGCDTYLRWECDDRGQGRWVNAGVCA